MDFDIKLRPHHVTAFINFCNNKKYLLSDKEFIKEFQERNKGYHNDKFVLYWKNFLTNLYNNDKIRFLYTNYFDDVCDFCDIVDECREKNSKLSILVNSLDNRSLNSLWLIEWNIYDIKFIKNNLC